MPVYDCGVPDCGECEREFGPDRSRAIASYNAKLQKPAILTDFVHPPIRDRSHDWSAVRDGYEPGAPLGRGATEAEAVSDLLDQETE